MTEVPKSLLALAAEFPADEVDDAAALLRDDLPAAARAWAETAAGYGDQGEWWQVFCEIERLRGRPFADAIAELPGAARRWLAAWCFERGRSEEGLAAYAAYLDDAPGDAPPGADPTLDAAVGALLAAGRLDEAVRLVDRVASDPAEAPGARGRICIAQARAGDPLGAGLRLAPVIERYNDDGLLWAASAIVRARQGHPGAGETALFGAARHGVPDEAVLAEMLDALGVDRARWEALRAELGPPDATTAARAWLADPGLALEPTDEPSPHAWGGGALAAPDCRGCGRPIRVWLEIDLGAVEPLKQKLPGFARLPLLSCPDCMVWMGRHDYELDRERGALALLNVAIDHRAFGETLGEPSPPPVAKPVRLLARPVRAGLDDDAVEEALGEPEEPQVAGAPRWTQDPERVWCPSCRLEMVFYGAMASTDAFDPIVSINNESGFQYHFACEACAIVSVIAQWT